MFGLRYLVEGHLGVEGIVDMVSMVKSLMRDTLVEGVTCDILTR